jgi:hypothetical protein
LRAGGAGAATSVVGALMDAASTLCVLHGRNDHVRVNSWKTLPGPAGPRPYAARVPTDDPTRARPSSARPEAHHRAGPTRPGAAHPGTAHLDADRLAALVAAAERAPADPDAAIDALGWLAPQLAQDRADGTLAAWARSTVVDELTGSPVLDRAVLAALQVRAGQPVEFPGAHAGLAHVYGYLLSTAATPYGPKRARWTDGDLAVALGHDPRHLLPWHRPDARTLLGRVTDATLPLLTDPRGTGTLLHRDDPVPGTTDALRTVVHRAQGVGTTGAAALVYGLVGPAGVRLVTVFPVDASPDRLRELEALPPVPRYNVLLDAPRATGPADA